MSHLLFNVEILSYGISRKSLIDKYRKDETKQVGCFMFIIIALVSLVGETKGVVVRVMGKYVYMNS